MRQPVTLPWAVRRSTAGAVVSKVTVALVATLPSVAVTTPLAVVTVPCVVAVLTRAPGAGTVRTSSAAGREGVTMAVQRTVSPAPGAPLPSASTCRPAVSVVRTRRASGTSSQVGASTGP